MINKIFVIYILLSENNALTNEQSMIDINLGVPQGSILGTYFSYYS